MKLKRYFNEKPSIFYRLSSFSRFWVRCSRRMKIDEYSQHTILSLYYDTDDFRFIRHSMDKPKYKEKFRIRSYGVPSQDSLVFLEIKKKSQWHCI